MHVANVISILSTKHPGKTIIKHDENNPTEIICEIEPTSDHPAYSSAIAVIDQSLPHYHKYATETYEVLHGQLIITVDKKEITLNEGEKIVINPNQLHWAKGNETIVKVSSKPGWSSDDHILV